MPFFISFSRFFFRACKLKFEKDQKIETGIVQWRMNGKKRVGHGIT